VLEMLPRFITLYSSIGDSNRVLILPGHKILVRRLECESKLLQILLYEAPFLLP